MDLAAVLAVGAAVGAVIGVAGTVVAIRGTRPARRDAAAPRGPERHDAGRPAPPGLRATTPENPRTGEPSAPDLASRGIEALRPGVLVLGPDDQVLLANPSARQLGLLGPAPADQTVGHAVLRALARRARRSGGAGDAELQLPRAGREPLGVHARVTSLGDGHVVIEVEDMTEMHRVTKVRRDFVANVSHELKTPVGALHLLAEALVGAADDPEAGHRFAERIRHESTRLSRLVTELLELSRLEGGEPLPEPEPVALDRVVAEVLDRSRTAASAKHIAVRVAGRRGLRLHGHERLLVTAVGNLVDNAIAYSPGGTTVTVSPSKEGDQIVVAVTDQGIGIAPEDQDRIFERFYRVDRARSRATGGTGLGLAIVKHVATNHGGTVSVRSDLGAGSTFILRLPARPPRVTAALHDDVGLTGLEAHTPGPAAP